MAIQILDVREGRRVKHVLEGHHGSLTGKIDDSMGSVEIPKIEVEWDDPLGEPRWVYPTDLYLLE